MLDYIIVGFGLAGMSYTEQLRKEGKSFVVITEEERSSSQVAGGMYNPVVLKRFTAAWNASLQLDYAIPFYKTLERYLNNTFLYPYPVLRIFNTIEEQNNWLIASDKPTLSSFLSSKFLYNRNECIEADNALGLVKKAGRLHVAKLLESYKVKLVKTNQYVLEKFDYDTMVINNDGVSYKTFMAKRIVFAEGYGMVKNPYFNYLPLIGSKGEVLIIKASNLNLDAIVKSSVFIIPLEKKDHYLIGATYHRTDKSWKTTPEAKAELQDKLHVFFKCNYEIIHQLAGIRPTVKDRRPLVGQHPKHKNMYLLNGMGTRGVMVAPTTSAQLYESIENKKPLDTAVDIKRFEKLYKNE